ncbi:MAG: hypothetical protein GXY83_14815 [Rhodopirellula sp.]|nr:hypothetical protein [Rhodopirellula sp.]
MPETISEPEEIFTLDILEPFLPGFSPPEEPHQPSGDWRLQYGLYSLGAVRGIGRRVGDFAVCRQQRGPEAFVLDIQCRRPVGPGYTSTLTAQIEAQLAPLPIPTQWFWESEILDSAGSRVPGSQLRRAAVLGNGRVEIDGKRGFAVSGPCTLNWLLFEAVGRLPRAESALPDFTLLDDFDRPKPGHNLRYDKRRTVLVGQRTVPQTQLEELPKGRIHKSVWGRTGGRPVELHAYQHTGEGIVPFLYWVDAAGRLLFAVSGLEAFVLDSFQRS